MNRYLISEYLQLLRKEHGYTQEDLAQRLNISRQAVSKWETGNTVPDLDILLKLSKLHHLTINHILEPDIQPKKICDFEEITKVAEVRLKEILGRFHMGDIMKALMGASPKVNDFLQRIYPEIDFQNEQKKIGRIRMEEVEEIQNQIVAMINIGSRL